MPLYLVEDYKQNLLRLRGIFPGLRTEGGVLTHPKHHFIAVEGPCGAADPACVQIYEGGDHGNKVRERLETRLFGFFSDKLEFSRIHNVSVPENGSDERRFGVRRAILRFATWILIERLDKSQNRRLDPA